MDNRGFLEIHEWYAIDCRARDCIFNMHFNRFGLETAFSLSHFFLDELSLGQV